MVFFFVVCLPRMTQVFCSLGMKDMIFQHRQKSNPMLWSVGNAEFVERGNWRLGRDGLGVMEKIGEKIVITGVTVIALDSK